MATSDRMTMIGPTVVGSVRRFRRLVLIALGAGLFIGLLWWSISPSEYAGKAGLVITPLPASLTVGLGTAHVSVATFNAQQVAILESPAVAANAANKVNAAFSDAHLSGQQIQDGTSVKLPTPGSAAAGASITHVTVILPKRDLRARSRQRPHRRLPRGTRHPGQHAGLALTACP